MLILIPNFNLNFIVMEKQVLMKKEEKTFVNGFIVSVQLPGVPPKQSFVDASESLAKTIDSILNSTPHAIILVQASINL